MGPLSELWLAFAATGGTLREATLLFPDPDAASAAPGDPFQITVVNDQGQTEPVSYATGATLTFLREALGCTMTEASLLYARLLREPAELSWHDARLGFGARELSGQPLHGLYVRLTAPTAAG